MPFKITLCALYNSLFLGYFVSLNKVVHINSVNKHFKYKISKVHWKWVTKYRKGKSVGWFSIASFFLTTSPLLIDFQVWKTCSKIYNNWVISRALIGRRLWLITEQSMEMTWFLFLSLATFWETLTGQEKREIEHVCIWNPMATDLLRKHWFTSSVWNICCWVADVPPRETSQAASSDEKRLFWQASIRMISIFLSAFES